MIDQKIKNQTFVCLNCGKKISEFNISGMCRKCNHKEIKWRYRQTEKGAMIHKISKKKYNEKLKMKKQKEYEKEYKRYKKAYEILMEYFDSISDEEKPEVDKQLKRLGL